MSFINSFLFQLAFGDWFGFFFFDCWWSHYRSLSTRSRYYRIGCTWTLSIWYTSMIWNESHIWLNRKRTEPWSPHPTLLYFTYRARSVFNRIFRFEMGRNSSSLALSPYVMVEVKVKFRSSPSEDHFTLIPRLNNSFAGKKDRIKVY